MIALCLSTHRERGKGWVGEGVGDRERERERERDVCLFEPYMYALYVCLICMPYMYALYVCLMCMPRMYFLYVYLMYALYVCLIYALHVVSVTGHPRAFGLWRVRFPPVLVRTARRLPVEAPVTSPDSEDRDHWPAPGLFLIPKP